MKTQTKQKKVGRPKGPARSQITLWLPDSVIEKIPVIPPQPYIRVAVDEKLARETRGKK